MEEAVRRTIPIPKSIYEAIQEMSTRHFRSFNDEVSFALNYYIMSMKNQLPAYDVQTQMQIQAQMQMVHAMQECKVEPIEQEEPEVYTGEINGYEEVEVDDIF